MSIINTFLIAALGMALMPNASAQAYPAKPVRMIISTAAGGSADTIGRIVAAKMSESLGQQIIVDNRTGSAGVVATSAVAKSAPDGYTLLLAYGSHVINPSIYPKLPYDTLKDFVSITQVAAQPLMLNIHPALPAKSVKELIALAKARPGQLNYATSGSGSGGHLATVIMNKMAGITMVHVPYKGSAPAMIDSISGQCQVHIASLITSLPHVRGGRVRGIGVTSAKRSAAAPDIPAIAETLPGYEVVNSYYLLAPAGLPADVHTRLHADAVKAIRHPEVVERLARDGADPVGNTPAQATRYIEGEIQKWGKAVRESGAKADG